MLALELTAFSALAAVGLWLVWRAGAGPLRWVAVAAVLLATTGAIGFLLQSSTKTRHAEPIGVERQGSLGSGACRSCHPSEFASWHRTFHRTMTQLATPDTVRGPWDGVKLEADGRSIELLRRGDELWARLPDPDLVAAAIVAHNPTPHALVPLVTRHVLLTTGSHHHQVFWVGGERGNELRMLPITYLLAEQRYVPRRDAFLQPPDAAPHAIRWNSNCIQCHATRGEPRLDERNDRFASSATELGIACEACHGPGAAHVAKQQNPLTRLATHSRNAADASIVNPARLTPARASEVCGQCHAYFVPRDEERWWQAGFTDYRPGDELARTHALLEPASAAGAGASATPAPAAAPSVEADTESLFWRDGTMRVGGRELNGLAQSRCFLRGSGARQLSCLSCHSMHASEPDDQLRRGESTDASCAHCHAREATEGVEHTHHAPGSAGAACVACHMPYTSYALFTAIRSHRIDAPSATNTATSGRPNACNLCHLARTLAWTGEVLTRWYPRRAAQPPAAETQRTDSAPLDSPNRAAPPDPFASTEPRALEELIAGDAATRAVVAAAFGRREAQTTSSAAWRARALAELLDDPYAAVRKVACDALRAQTGFSDFRCDFGADEPTRRATRAEAVSRAAHAEAASHGTARASNASDWATFETRIHALRGARDERPVTISE